MKEISKILLDIEAVSLSPSEPFIWASGIKSPIYCDNRLILSYPEERRIVESGLTKLIEDNYPGAEYIMGTATAGIPHAALIAQNLKLPMGFVRSSNKDHGKQNKIEGKIVKGAKVVVIEDLISTGGSSIEAAKALEEAGFEVLAIVAIFSYNLESAKENFKGMNFGLKTLTNFEELAEVAAENGIIKEEDILKLNKWRKNPKDESWIK